MILNKSTAHRGNNFRQNFLKPIWQDFQNDFIRNITETYRPIMIQINMVTVFWNQSNVSFVKFFQHMTMVKKGSNHIANQFANNIPALNVETSLNIIGHRSFKGVQLFHSFINFLI